MDKRAMELTLARMAKDVLPYSIDQRLLLPPDMRDWLPEGHLALFVDDLVEQLDLSAIYRTYQSADDRGRRGYHQAMMVKLLVYAYCVGKPSSRKIERATRGAVRDTVSGSAVQPLTAWRAREERPRSSRTSTNHDGGPAELLPKAKARRTPRRLVSFGRSLRDPAVGNRHRA